MIPDQTCQILLGVATAFLYAAAVAGIGIHLLTPIIAQAAKVTIRDRLGFFSFAWLGFVLGQGVLGLTWLGLSLYGLFNALIIELVCALGLFLFCISAVKFRHEFVESLRSMRRYSPSLLSEYTSYSLICLVVAAIVSLRFFVALLPPVVDDAIKYYLVVPKIIPTFGRLDMLPALHPFYALLPVQVEMHWAALFTLSNEAAVTSWDFLCALTFLTGTALFAWRLTSSGRIALVTTLLILSTPAFYSMMGAGKVDNAAAQYGIAAFFCVVLWPMLGRRAIVLAGLYAGWAMASRYTNFIIVPGLAVFAVWMIARASRECQTEIIARPIRFWATNALLAGLAATVTLLPMLIKNYVLVGCAFAPQFGCPQAFWTIIHKQHLAFINNISVVDLVLYPFVWTFAERDSMLGNISPLFLGLLPFLILAKTQRSAFLKPSFIAGLAGLICVGTWLFVKPLVLYTRWLLIPLSLFAVTISAAAVTAEQQVLQLRGARILVKSAVVIVLLFLAFESRPAVYAMRYLISADSRAGWYKSSLGYDVASWLNAHVEPGERVALANYSGHRYFLEPRLVLNSESADEIQWLWQNGEWRYGSNSSITPASWRPEFWRFYIDRGFKYVVVAKPKVAEVSSAWPPNVDRIRLQVVLTGEENDVFRIERL